MSRAILFLHTLEDARYAASVLGLPLELIPDAGIHGDDKIRVTEVDELESAYRKLRDLNASNEFTALRV
ncbi:MAG TPA: hypothetical protein ENK05_04115 [Gammaproteobacteria bacterium]|nr:hypothetical protein [Gammaproteobacteria bacterium]